MAMVDSEWDSQIGDGDLVGLWAWDGAIHTSEWDGETLIMEWDGAMAVSVMADFGDIIPFTTGGDIHTTVTDLVAIQVTAMSVDLRVYRIDQFQEIDSIHGQEVLT